MRESTKVTKNQKR